ncbi:glycosyltransferase [Thiothrix subterranea]|uniref:Glycosyltransferase n=1 Tax=Thiothrix subterranea TaxID=2735563 RepID=A0AA51R0Z2_9GAMM|nr:glycosyltransferase [Thiothrix subterranea]MDQ5767581.1 glycosyltransferase [Thiothrix subterranea]WML88537.1 glycosyltransferase [Thiothrix subterranea]
MRILFIHQNFPGQYARLAPALQHLGHEVLALSQRTESLIGGIRNINYRLSSGNTPDLHPFLINIESAYKRGEAVAASCATLNAQGYQPDIIYAHSGWGEALFLKEVWPKARVVAYFEYFYHEFGGDLNFDPEFPPEPHVGRKCTVRNLHLLATLDSCDIGVTATHWQHSLLPLAYQPKVHVIHEGIDTQLAHPNTGVTLQIQETGDCIQYGDKVLTFVNRNLEPARGYHQFMRALPAIQQAHPDMRVFIVGGDSFSYGKASLSGQTWKQLFLEEVQAHLDMRRIHFTGQIPYAIFLKLLQLSRAHVYLSYPFVVSWSLLEAMSTGCRIIAADTAPIREVISHENTGLLIDFLSPDALATTVCQVLSAPERYETLADHARAHAIQHYDFTQTCLPQHLKLLHSMRP